MTEGNWGILIDLLVGRGDDQSCREKAGLNNGVKGGFFQGES